MAMTEGQTIPKPVPIPDQVTGEFWDATKEGRLMIQRCRTCAARYFYPRERCPECLSDDVEWTDVSGKGRVYSFIVVRQPGHPGFNEDVPYVYAVITLDEDVRMFGNIKGIDIDDVEIDMPVEVYFEQRGDQMLPQWKPKGAPDPE